MKIQCPSCKHAGDVPNDKIPSAGVTVSCPKCKTQFQINSPTNSTPKPDLYCPKCGTGQPSSDTCINCGTVFSKFIREQTTKEPVFEQLQSSIYNDIAYRIQLHKYKIVSVFIVLIVLIGLLIWKYYPNRTNRVKVTISNKSSEESSTQKMEVQPDPLRITDSYKGWAYEDVGYNPAISFKVTNRLNSKISVISFRAVWLKNGNEQLFTASASLFDLDPGVTSKRIKLIPSNSIQVPQSKQDLDFNVAVESLNRNLTVRVYYECRGSEKLVYDGPFNASFNVATPFF